MIKSLVVGFIKNANRLRLFRASRKHGLTGGIVVWEVKAVQASGFWGLTRTIQARSWLQVPASGAYLWAMPRKPVEILPAAAKAFMRDMRAFFMKQNQLLSSVEGCESASALRN
jgi:hypothetical protein